MTTRAFVTGNLAAAHGARLARSDVVAAYPITPQTQIVEHISEFVADGKMDCEFIRVESEHSAMAASIGAAYGGVRVFTATSSHGLAYMHEMLHWAAHARLPIVMGMVNRSMGPPWAIWSDHQDSISARDTGWMQLYVENNQEVLDTCIQAFKVAEHPDVQLPLFFCQDAFILSHTSAEVEMPDQKLVDKFLGKRKPLFKMDCDNPATFGNIMSPDYYMELKYGIEESMVAAKRVLAEVGKEFGDVFGRPYGLVEEYRCEDADAVLVAVGAVAGNARVAVDSLRKKGKNVGLLKLRSYRPFPDEDVRRLAAQVGTIAVLDRAMPMGARSQIASDIMAACYDMDDRPAIQSHVTGIGGREVSPAQIEAIGEQALKGGSSTHPTWLGLKEA